MMARTASVKYVFVDIVKFTVDRSVEAQTDLISALNQQVQEAVKGVGITRNKRIFIPTGDGVCVAIINVTDPFDIHLLLAIDLLKRISDYNAGVDDISRQFQVRIGINENVDNLVMDVNGRQNVAGEGVNRAQRVMNIGDGGCIMLSQAVFDMLKVREKYYGAFQSFDATDKHDQRFSVYQFTKQGHPGLSTEKPSVYHPKTSSPARLTTLCGYYMAIAHKNRQWLDTVDLRTSDEYAAKILIYMLANDALANSKALRTTPLSYTTYGSEHGMTRDEQMKYYKQVDHDLKYLIATRLVNTTFKDAMSYFEDGTFLLPNEAGLEKLSKDFPDIFKEYCGE